MKSTDEVKNETAAEVTSHREKDWNADRQELSPTNDKPEHFDEDEVMRADPTAGDSPESLGAPSERDVKPSKVTLGRHVTSEPGFKVADRRHKHVATHRAEKDKLFEKK